MKRTLRAALAAAVLAIGGVSAQAASLSFSGNLAGDDAMQLFTFTLATDSAVTLRTWSYAGGTNAAGNSIASGGFDPIVSLFAGSGPSALLIGANDDGLGVAVDVASGEAFDSLLELDLPLPSGTYTVALTQFAGFATGTTLGDGFNLSEVVGFGGRSSAWALDFLGVDSAAQIPLPGSAALAALALAALLVTSGPLRPRRKSS